RWRRSPLSAPTSPPKRRRRKTTRRWRRSPLSAPTSPPRRRRKTTRRWRRSPRFSIASRPKRDLEFRIIHERPDQSPAVSFSRVTCEPITFKDVNDPLRDIEERRSSRFGDVKMCNKAARSAAMCNGDRVALEAPVPPTHARRHHLVTFPTWRHKTPLIVFARGRALRIARTQLRYREAFPVAKRDFSKPRFYPIAIGREAEHRPHQ